MKSIGKHRGPGHSPRSGAAALMIGGLVAGTVATAGATTLRNPDVTDPVAVATTEPTPTPEATTSDASDRAAALASLHSASLSEVRDQVAADRSEARSAPEDADAAEIVLAASAFTGHTLEVDTPAEVTEEAPAATEVVEETVEATPQVTQTQSRESAPARATTPEPAPAPAREPAPAPAPVGGSILGIAASYVGSPYVLPGNPPYTFDCSAYTWYVYQQAGIDIPRSVSGQKAAVTPVSNPQPGDLIFYNDFYHVGIYAGNGMTYEALNPSAGVRYGPLVNTNVWYGRIG